MIDFSTAMIGAPMISLWFGFLLERSYRQGTTSNLIGYAVERGLSSKRAERAVAKHFGKWDWLLHAFAVYSATLAVIFHFHETSTILVAAMSALSVSAFVKCLFNLTRHYKKAQCELS